VQYLGLGWEEEETGGGGRRLTDGKCLIVCNSLA
jgi:hypothetical protein